MAEKTIKIVPKQDYLLVETMERETGVVKTRDIRDRKPKGRVLAVGPGVWDHGKFIPTTTEVGEVVYYEEAAEANTPDVLRDMSPEQYLVKESRVVAAEVEA